MGDRSAVIQSKWAIAMKSNDLSVEVEDEHIVVTMPGRSFRASFFKSADSVEAH